MSEENTEKAYRTGYKLGLSLDSDYRFYVNDLASLIISSIAEFFWK